MEESKSFTLKFGHKTSFFDYHRQFLTGDHPYHRNKNAFIKNSVERSPPPPSLDGGKVWRRVENVPKVKDCGKAQTTSGMAAPTI